VLTLGAMAISKLIYNDFFSLLPALFTSFQEKGDWNTKYFLFIQFSLYLIKHAIENFLLQTQMAMSYMREKLFTTSMAHR
jgi:hypothetical protein